MAYDIGPKIGIDGEAEFRKELTKINNSLRTLDTELKKVASEFQDNAQSEEALIAKNKVLTKSIAEQEKKIEEARKALAFARSEYDESSQQVQKWQQVLNRAETSLNDLKSEIKQNDKALEEIAQGFRDAETGAKKMDAAIDGVDANTSKFKNIADAADNLATKLSAVSKGAAALGGAVIGTVPATQEFRRDLSFLEQNAKQVGVGIGAAEQAFKTFNAVSGETDSSIEGVSNLLQAGFTESNLQIAVEGLAGAATRFPDTLKIEGLADGLQETLATGKAIGPFAELLDRVGVGADNFSADLAKCKTEAEKQNLALETLAKAGLIDSYKGWRKSNKELADYDNAMLDAQMAISDLATTVAPLVTSVAKNLTKLVKAFNDLPKPVQAAAGGLVGLTAVASPTINAVGKLSNGIDILKDKKEVLAKGSSKLFGILKAHPYAIAAAGAVTLAFALKDVVENINAETTAAKKAAEERQKTINNVKKESDTAKFYAQQLEQLSEVENKSASQKQLMQLYVDTLNKSVEGLNLTYDAENDKLNQTTESIYKKINAQREEALQAAYVKAAKDAYEDYANAQIKASEIGSELSAKKEKWNRLTESEKQVNGQLAKEISNLKKEYKDATNATSKYAKEAQKLNNQAAIQSGQWKALKKEAKSAGIEIPENLVQGIKSGTFAIPTTIDELNALIEFQVAIDNAGVQGQELVNNLTAKIANGKISVTEATKQLTDANEAQLSKGAQAATGKGQQTGANYASGAKSQTGAASSAGQALGNSANSGAGSISLYGAGKNAGKGYANGLRDAIGAAAAAAREIAQKALEAAEKESEIRSPSRKWKRRVGLMDAAGMAEGLRAGIPIVQKAGAELESAALPQYAQSTVNFAMENTEKISAVAQAAFNVAFDYDRLTEAFAPGIYIEGRMIGRAMREAGVIMT